MNKKNVLIIGAGKRVRHASLPVLERLSDSYSLAGIFSRTEKKIPYGGREYETAPIETLDRGDFSGVDLIWLAVTKESVPGVLKKLVSFDLSRIDLLIETPVLLFKHLGRAGRMKRFRNTWVAEDLAALPIFDVVREALYRGLIGELEQVVFHQSAYKYHGLAAAKTWLDCTRIISARRKRTPPGNLCRCLRFSNHKTALIHEPRDYSKGRILFSGSRGTLSDQPGGGPGDRLLEPITSNGSWTGFRVGDLTVPLEEAEIDLMGEASSGLGITARMEDLKRVGLYRLLGEIHGGKGAYSLREALDDMVIDYFLDKIGFFPAPALFGVKSPLGALLLKTVTKLV